MEGECEAIFDLNFSFGSELDISDIIDEMIEEEDLPPTLPYSQSNESAMFILDEDVIVGEEVIAVANVSDSEESDVEPDVPGAETEGDPSEQNTRPVAGSIDHQYASIHDDVSDHSDVSDEPTPQPTHDEAARPVSRFYEMSTADLDEFRSLQKNKETTRKTMSHLRLLTEYLKGKDEVRFIEEIEAEELDRYLGEFFVSVRKEKPDGNGSTQYEPSSLRSMRASFERHLKEKEYGHCLMTSPAFHYSREMIAAKSKELKKQGKGNQASASDSLNDDEIDQLWEAGALGLTNPQSMIHTVWWNNTMLFGMRGVTEHYNLRWGGVTMKTSTDGVSYLEHNERQSKMRSGGVPDVKACKSQMWELPGNPRCPVAAYKAYKSKCPDEATQPDEPFYFQAKPYTASSSLIMAMGNEAGARVAGHSHWFKRQKYGVKTLAQFMKRICSNGKISSHKKLTNTSVRKAMVQKLMKANIPPTDIMQKSGHKRVESILHYGRLQESQQAAMTHILTTPTAPTSNSTLNYAQYNSMFQHTSNTSIHHGPPPYIPSAGKF